MTEQKRCMLCGAPVSRRSATAPIAGQSAPAEIDRGGWWGSWRAGARAASTAS